MRFRKGPEDVPASTTLLIAAIAGVVVLNLLLMLALPTPEAAGNPVFRLALELAMLLLSVHLVLRLAGHAERFVQTVTAIFGCQLVLAPALAFSRWVIVTHYKPGGEMQPVMFIPALIGLYLLILTARILRSATGWTLTTCVFLLIAIEALSMLVMLALFAAPAGAPTPAAA
jgi:hypothetical protein